MTSYLLCLFAVNTLQAQNDVQVTISVLPPYSAYLQDYAGAGKQVQIFVRNTTTTRLNIRLQGSVTGDNGVAIQTVPNYRPPVPLTLEPLQNRLLTYADLSGLFDLSQLDVQGVDRNNLYKGLPLPEGSYQLCIRAFDNATSRPLSPENPLGCSPPFPIRAVEPPILIAPLCDATVQPLTPQNLIFTWTPPIGVSPALVDYTLRIVELPLETADPNVFIDAVVLPKSGVEVKGLKASTFLYSVVQPPLIPGKKYAWRVQARDLSGKTNFLNDGKSPVCAFTYGTFVKPEIPAAPDEYVAFVTPGPPTGKGGKTLPVLYLGKGRPLYIAWQPTPKLLDALAKKSPGNLFAPSYRLVLTKLPMGGKKGGVVLTKTVSGNVFSADRKDLPDALETGRTYRATLEVMGLNTEVRKQYGLPATGAFVAEPRSFSLVKQNVGAESDSVVVRGTLAFRYPGEVGEPHRMPNTAVMVKEMAPNGYEGTVMVGKTNDLGDFRMAIPREFINPVDTLVDKSLSDKGKGDAPSSVTYVYTRYRVVAANGYLLPPDQTFQLSDKQVGDFQMGTLVALARGHRVSITARQAYKNWPGAPDVKLDGKTLIVFRKPNTYTQKEWLPVEGDVDHSPDGPNIPGPGNKPSGKTVSAVVAAAKKDVKQAGYTFIGSAVLKTDGGGYKTSMDRLLYKYVSGDGYMIYCPDCGQTPGDAEFMVFDAPKEALSPALARTENYTLLMQTTEPPAVTFTGKLAYAFAGSGNGANKKPMGNTRVTLQIVYRDQSGDYIQNDKYATTIPEDFSDYHTGLNPELATAVTTADGSFTFDLKLTKPLILGDLPKTAGHGGGEFKVPATVYRRALRVVVSNPYYASPAETFGDVPSLEVKPLQAYDLGNLTARVKSYNLTVQLKSDTTGLSQVLKQQAGVRQELSGVTVYAIRKERKGSFPLSPYAGPPLDEGQGLNEKKAFGADKFQYIVVAKDKTNAEGKVVFGRMVMANGEDDAYLLAVESNIDGLNNYKLESAPKSVMVTEGWGPTYSSNPTPNEKAQSDKLNKTIKGYQQVNCTTNTYVRKSYTGTVTSEIIGPMDPASANAYLQGGTSPYYTYSVFTKEENCQQQSGYWVGDKLVNTKINAKILINGGYQGGLFADRYARFDADLVQRYLAPGKPTVRVRVVDKTNPTQGIAAASVTLGMHSFWGSNVSQQKVYTGPDGWATFQSDVMTKAYLTIDAPGYVFDSYSDKEDGATTAAKAATIELGDLNLGQNAYYPRVLMLPNTRIIGATLDQDAMAANPDAQPKPSVEAYVQVDNGFYAKTFFSNSTKKWRFSAYGTNKADSLKIFPLNISYFNEYRLVKQLPAPKLSTLFDEGSKGISVIDAGDIPIFQRDHRLLFDIRTPQNTKLDGAYVRLFGRHEKGFEFGPTDKVGSLDVKFKNVTVENLFVEISRPGYVTKVLSMSNVESKKVAQQTIVYLDEANLITGKVVGKAADGTEKPLAGAEVFVDMGANSQTPVSTTSAANGAFTLAVPKGLKNVTVQATYNEAGVAMSGGGGPVGTLNGQPVNVGAVNIGAGQTYVGTSAKQDLPQAGGQLLKLTLQAYSGFKIADIWGFPVKIEKVKDVGGGKVEVSGEVALSDPAYGPFAIMDPSVRVRFEKVLFKASSGNASVGEPVNSTVDLKTGILDQLGYFEKKYTPGQVPRYNIKLMATEGAFGTGVFKIIRKGGSGYGQVYAKAQLIDNSFNFSENLFSYAKGQFFLFDPEGRRGTNVEVIAFESGGDKIKRTNFGLCQEDGKPLEMKLLAFQATSSVDGSRLKGDEIHLNPTLSCHIKDAIPESISVTVGDLVLKNNTIDGKSGDTPLTFKLAGNWSVEVRNWTLDYTKGGFYSTEGVVKTGKVDVPISLFNLRADFFKLEAAPAKTLDLAGVAKLNVKGKAFFAYDAATGSDMKGHWSVVVTPNGGGTTAAYLDAGSGLPGITSNLDFETISLLDNGEDVLTFGNGSKEFGFFNGVVQGRPKTIETGKDYFAFDASFSTTIPNAPKDRQVRFTYYRPGGNGPVALKTVMIDDYKIDTKGQVAFNAVRDVAKDGGEKMAIYFADGIMAMRGYMEEPGQLKIGNAKGGVLLVHSVQPGGTTFITHDRDFSLDSPTSADFAKLLQIPLVTNPAQKAKPLSLALGNKAFSQIYLTQVVNGSGQWDLMRFSGIPTGFTMLPAEEVNRMAFTNYGAVRAEGQKIKADGLGKTEGKDGNAGFAGLTLEFDMANSRLTGTLPLPPNMPLPPTMTVKEGMAQVVIDPAGFYIVASATVRDVPLIIPITMKAGLMLGFYDSPNFSAAEPILFMSTHRKSLPCAFTSGFKGVFVNGQIPIPLIDDFSYEQSFVVGKVKMGLNAYIDGYAFASYKGSGAFDFGAGLGAGIHYYAYGSVLNVSASGSVDVDGSQQYGLTVDIPNKRIAMNMDMKLSADFKAKLYVDLGLKSYSTDQEIGFCLGMALPNVSYQIGGGIDIATPKFTCDVNKCESPVCKTVNAAQ